MSTKYSSDLDERIRAGVLDDYPTLPTHIRDAIVDEIVHFYGPLIASAIERNAPPWFDGDDDHDDHNR